MLTYKKLKEKLKLKTKPTIQFWPEPEKEI